MKKLLTLLLLLAACGLQQPAAEQSPFREGDTLRVDITAVDSENYGVADVFGYVIKVKDANVSEDVQVVVEKTEGALTYARIVASAGELMVEPKNETVAEPDAEEQEAVEFSGDEILAYEGDMIDLRPKIVDPDGDKVTLEFTSPFSNEGKWQTKVGDAGFYSVVVTATDSKGSLVTKVIKVRVQSSNRPPVIDVPLSITVKEGETVRFNPKVTDPDKDNVKLSFSGWMKEATYRTTYEDAGTHKVILTADDGTQKATKEVVVVVTDSNRPPQLQLSEIRVLATAGDVVELEAKAKDPDGDNVKITYESPFDASGRWQSADKDAGTYEIEVSATDGKDIVTQEVLVELQRKNTPPVITSLSVSPEFVELKKPGDEMVVEVKVAAIDADGDSLKISFSGAMDSAKRTFSYGERGGIKTVKVTVSDGRDSVSKELTFTVNNWPCFDCSY